MDLDALFQSAGQNVNIDPDLLKAQGMAESSLRPGAVGPATRYGQAIGIAQILPSTAARYGVTDPAALKDPTVAIPLQARIMADNLAQYDGDIEKAVLAYHGGTNPKNWGPKTNAYADKVSNLFQQIKAQRAQNGGLDPMPQGNGDALTNFIAQNNANQGGQDAMNSFIANNHAAPQPAQQQPQQPQQDQSSWLHPLPPARNLAQAGNNFHDNMLGAQAMARNMLDKPAEGAAWLYDKANQLFGGNSNEFDRVRALDAQEQQRLAAQAYNPQQFHGGQVTMGIAGTSKLPVLGQSGGIVARTAGGAATGAVAGALTANQGQEGADALHGGLAGGALSAVLPPVVGRAIQAIRGASNVASRVGNVVRPAPEAAPVAPEVAQPAQVTPEPTPQVFRPQRAQNVQVQEATEAQPAPQWLNEQELNQLRASQGHQTPAEIEGQPTQQTAQPTPQASVPEQQAAPQPAEPVQVPAGKTDSIENVQQVSPEAAGALVQAGPQPHLTPDQALRKAEMEAIGAKPTVGQITRNFEDQQVERELAKDNQAGAPLRANDSANNRAILNHTENLIQQMGGVADHPQAWENVANALQKQKDDLENTINGMYQAARQKAGDAPVVDLSPILKTMQDMKPQFLASTEGTALRNGVNAQLKAFGVANGKGNQLLSVNDAERMRQFLNNVSTYENSGLIAKLKNALDESVNSTGQGGLFDQARAARRELGQKFESNQAIKDILALKKGTNDRVVPYDKAMQKYVTGGGSADHLSAIIKRLNGATTPEQQALAQKALASLKSATLNAAYQKAIATAATNELGDPVFSGAAFKKSLDSIGMRKLSTIYGQQELGRLGSLTRAGINLTTSVPGAVNHSNTTSAAANMIGRLAHHIPVAKQAMGAWHLIQQGVAANANKAAVVRALSPDEALRNALKQSMHKADIEKAREIAARLPVGNAASIASMLLR